MPPIRNLILVLGDQLTPSITSLSTGDPGRDLNRMSAYCGGCQYDVKQRTGPGARLFNALYRDLVSRLRSVIGSNPRMTQMVRPYDKFLAGL